MRILGIETSCDETSAAVVEDGRLVLSNVVSSQVAVHAPFGGVVPEIASRQHVEYIVPIVQRALSEAGMTRSGVDAVAVTYGPGLAGSLLVGVSFARGLERGLSVPLLPVNHLDGHLHSVWLATALPLPAAPEFPLLALVVSGGHTELVLMEEHARCQVIGRTLDDAAGEAFDKVARLLGLGYPGGPEIERAAAAADTAVTLPRAELRGTSDFSFSGLKTAVLHAVYETASGRSANEVRGVRLPRVDVSASLSVTQVASLAAGFQESVVDVLVRKTAEAAKAVGAHSVAVVGGVAANKALRQRMTEAITLPLWISGPEFSTDNAAMIASAAYFPLDSNVNFDIEPALSLSATHS